MNLIRPSIACIALLFSALLLPAQRAATIQPGQLAPLTQEGPTASTLPQGKPSNPLATPAAKTATVSPIPLGTMANIFSSTIPMNNCVMANDSTGAVTFIHRNNPTLFGGSAFGLRYDISTDAGATWNMDLGILNPTNLSGRYPQIANYDGYGSTAPLAGQGIWLSDHYDGLAWAGFNAGTTALVTTGTPVTQEVLFPTMEQTSSGGMAEGLHGEYWAARFNSAGGDLGDSLKIYKGIYNPGNQTIAWNFHTSKTMPWDMSIDAQAHGLVASVAFSPDGSIGWIATLGDILNGADSVFSPILVKSTDGGATWAIRRRSTSTALPGCMTPCKHFGWTRSAFLPLVARRLRHSTMTLPSMRLAIPTCFS